MKVVKIIGEKRTFDTPFFFGGAWEPGSNVLVFLRKLVLAMAIFLTGLDYCKIIKSRTILVFF